MTIPPTSDIVERASPFSFPETLERLKTAINRAGMILFASIDHEAGAHDVGLALPPTSVLIYGSPKNGTPIMQAAPLAALDLPLRVLVRQASDGTVRVAYHPIAPTLRVAGVPDHLATGPEPAQRLLLVALEPSPH